MTYHFSRLFSINKSKRLQDDRKLSLKLLIALNRDELFELRLRFLEGSNAVGGKNSQVPEFRTGTPVVRLSGTGANSDIHQGSKYQY